MMILQSFSDLDDIDNTKDENAEEEMGEIEKMLPYHTIPLLLMKLKKCKRFISSSKKN